MNVHNHAKAVLQTVLTLSASVVLFGGVAGVQTVADSAPPTQGMIVSIRGNIVQIQPLWLRGHTRLIVDDRTQIVEEVRVPVSNLQPGVRVEARGARNAQNGIDLYWIQAGILGSSDNGNLVGVQSDGSRVFFGGTLRSVSPFVVRDDAGTDIAATPRDRVLAHLTHRIGVSDLMIGQRISFDFDKIDGGIYHAIGVSLSSTPGRAGIVFATVVSRHDDQLTVVPRFGSDPLPVTLSPKLRVQRQITYDLESVKVGQTVTAWGMPSSRDDLTAYALMPNVATFPAASDDPGAGDRTITGTIASLSPVQMRLADGKTESLSITGQTPLMDLRDATAAALKPGEKIMLTLSKDAAGHYSADYILIDASPILAFGM